MYWAGITKRNNKRRIASDVPRSCFFHLPIHNEKLSLTVHKFRHLHATNCTTISPNQSNFCAYIYIYMGQLADSNFTGFALSKKKHQSLRSGSPSPTFLCNTVDVQSCTINRSSTRTSPTLLDGDIFAMCQHICEGRIAN